MTDPDETTEVEIEIEATGLLLLIQDLGRSGFARQGVGRSGAFDRTSHRLAQRLVGNDESAAGFEVTLGGMAFRCGTDLTIAVTGAQVELTVAGRSSPTDTSVDVPAGELVRLGRCLRGVRSYVAVAGGITVEPTLGSRATDVMSGLGPPVVQGGDRMPVGSQPAGRAHGSPSIALPDQHERRVLRVVPGPREDWFVAAALDTLCSATYVVDPASNRVGVRLNGPTLDRINDSELPSEPTLPGAIQVPPNGLPVVFGPDGPVTGGYPVIAVVVEDDVDMLAQARPGDPLRYKRFR